MLIDSQQHMGNSATISKRQRFKYTLRTVFPYSRKKLIGTSRNYWKPLHGQLVKCQFRCARPRCDRRVHRNSSALTSSSCLIKFINWWLPQWPSNTWMVLVCVSCLFSALEHKHQRSSRVHINIPKNDGTIQGVLRRAGRVSTSSKFKESKRPSIFPATQTAEPIRQWGRYQKNTKKNMIDTSELGAGLISLGFFRYL